MFTTVGLTASTISAVASQIFERISADCPDIFTSPAYVYEYAPQVNEHINPNKSTILTDVMNMRI
jgi:hypothetical protein